MHQRPQQAASENSNTRASPKQILTQILSLILRTARLFEVLSFESQNKISLSYLYAPPENVYSVWLHLKMSIYLKKKNKKNPYQIFSLSAPRLSPVGFTWKVINAFYLRMHSSQSWERHTQILPHLCITNTTFTSSQTVTFRKVCWRQCNWTGVPEGKVWPGG